MNENFEYTSPEEEALLNMMRDLTSRLPKNTMWIVHPHNYPRILKSVQRLLEVIQKVSPEAQYKIAFDELVGTGLCLSVRAWNFSFYGCRDFSEAILLADTFDMEANLDGEVCLLFGFHDARIPICLKKKNGPGE